mmetsp:Transcript_6628/g.8252  ORF Transcript_6628/g.8252 Transcript_6628/m.8252 type:complete len:227 (+) Transcript_6628:724-1404(+)
MKSDYYHLDIVLYFAMLSLYHDDYFPNYYPNSDVMSLGPPDGLFMDEIKGALKTISDNAQGKESPVIIRMMFGNILGMPVNCEAVLKELTSDLPEDSNLNIWVGAWRYVFFINICNTKEVQVQVTDELIPWKTSHRNNSVIEIVGTDPHGIMRSSLQLMASISTLEGTICGILIISKPTQSTICPLSWKVGLRMMDTCLPISNGHSLKRNSQDSSDSAQRIFLTAW